MPTGYPESLEVCWMIEGISALWAGVLSGIRRGLFEYYEFAEAIVAPMGQRKQEIQRLAMATHISSILECLLAGPEGLTPSLN